MEIRFHYIPDFIQTFYVFYRGFELVILYMFCQVKKFLLESNSATQSVLFHRGGVYSSAVLGAATLGGKTSPRIPTLSCTE